ncbi:hypothetical protein V4U86_21640 [Mycobacterium sp. AMU20-3851]|uniref:hypothetical protein n=1 Tax=Mycobacterium sp. AMU20-3851 TaxID=3122055 RepID=UPI003754D3B5
MISPVNLDEPATWPQELRDLAHEATQQEGCRGSNTVDLRPAPYLSDRIRSILFDYGVVVYQCARLLDSEVADIRLNGLRATSASLLHDKVRAAREEGVLTEHHAERLLTKGVLTAPEQRAARVDEVCALTILRTLTVDPYGTQPLLNYWGGEITYFWQIDEDPDLAEVLRSIGNPVLIEFQHRPCPTDHCSPELANVVIGRYQDLDDCAGEIHIRLPHGKRIPAIEVWQRDDFRWPPSHPTDEEW